MTFLKMIRNILPDIIAALLKWRCGGSWQYCNSHFITRFCESFQNLTSGSAGVLLRSLTNFKIRFDEILWFQIAKFMGPTCWPHEPCYQGYDILGCVEAIPPACLCILAVHRMCMANILAKLYPTYKNTNYGSRHMYESIIGVFTWWQAETITIMPGASLYNLVLVSFPANRMTCCLLAGIKWCKGSANERCYLLMD